MQKSLLLSKYFDSQCQEEHVFPISLFEFVTSTETICIGSVCWHSNSYILYLRDMLIVVSFVVINESCNVLWCFIKQNCFKQLLGDLQDSVRCPFFKQWKHELLYFINFSLSARKNCAHCHIACIWCWSLWLLQYSLSQFLFPPYYPFVVGGVCFFKCQYLVLEPIFKICKCWFLCLLLVKTVLCSFAMKRGR